jgi:hypothetical protein
VGCGVWRVEGRGRRAPSQHKRGMMRGERYGRHERAARVSSSTNAYKLALSKREAGWDGFEVRGRQTWRATRVRGAMQYRDPHLPQQLVMIFLQSGKGLCLLAGTVRSAPVSARISQNVSEKSNLRKAVRASN